MLNVYNGNTVPSPLSVAAPEAIIMHDATKKPMQGLPASQYQPRLDQLNLLPDERTVLPGMKSDTGVVGISRPAELFEIHDRDPADLGLSFHAVQDAILRHTVKERARLKPEIPGQHLVQRIFPIDPSQVIPPIMLIGSARAVGFRHHEEKAARCPGKGILINNPICMKTAPGRGRKGVSPSVKQPVQCAGSRLHATPNSTDQEAESRPFLR